MNNRDYEKVVLILQTKTIAIITEFKDDFKLKKSFSEAIETFLNHKKRWTKQRIKTLIFKFKYEKRYVKKHTPRGISSNDIPLYETYINDIEFLLSKIYDFIDYGIINKPGYYDKDIILEVMKLLKIDVRDIQEIPRIFNGLHHPMFFNVEDLFQLRRIKHIHDRMENIIMNCINLYPNLKCSVLTNLYYELRDIRVSIETCGVFSSNDYIELILVVSVSEKIRMTINGINSLIKEYLKRIYSIMKKIRYRQLIMNDILFQILSTMRNTENIIDIEDMRSLMCLLFTYRTSIYIEKTNKDSIYNRNKSVPVLINYLDNVIDLIKIFYC